MPVEIVDSEDNIKEFEETHISQSTLHCKPSDDHYQNNMN